MDKQPRIKRYETNKDKYNTYTFLSERRKIAIREGFYLEAINIEYAMIEERLLRFLYHCGFVENEFTRQISQDAPCTGFLHKIGCSIPQKGLELNVGNKIDIVKRTIKWSKKDPDESDPDDEYTSLLREFCCKCDEGVLGGDLTIWLKYRNEFVHGLVNKDINEVVKVWEQKALEGRKYVGEVDKIARAVNKYGKLRKAAGWHR